MQEKTERNYLKTKFFPQNQQVEPIKITLLDLVQAVSDFAKTDTETVATVTYLINAGKVKLCGIFTGAKINQLPSDCFGRIKQSRLTKRRSVQKLVGSGMHRGPST